MPGLGFLPPSQKPPLECLPSKYREVVEEAAKAFAVPAAVPLAALLVLVSASIGYTRRIKPKNSWREPANLYVAIVGRSGTGKSPCTSAILKPLRDEERRRAQKYQHDLSKYERELEDWKNLKANERRNFPKPKEPTWEQLLVDDATIEAVGQAMAPKEHDDPPHRGTLWIRDELSGMLLDMDRYAASSKGATKSRLLTAYDAGSWKVNRATKKRPEYIPHACVSLFGTIQPDMLPQAFDKIDAASGLLPRFLFVRAEPDRPPVWTDETFSESSADTLNKLTLKLLKLDFHAGEPKDICVSPEAMTIFIEWYDVQASEPWLDAQACDYEALSAKLRGQCLRLALILHYLWSAANGWPDLTPVGAKTMGHAIALANWFKEQQRHVWRLMGHGEAASEVLPLVKRVAEAVVALQDEINDCILTTGRITEKVNEGCYEAFRVKSDSVGRTLRKLGFPPHRDKKRRGVRILPDRLEGLKAVFCPASRLPGPYAYQDKPFAPVIGLDTEQAEGDGKESAAPGGLDIMSHNDLKDDACDADDAHLAGSVTRAYEPTFYEELGVHVNDDEEYFMPVAEDDDEVDT